MKDFTLIILFFFAGFCSVFGQQRTVEGKVLNEKSKPMPYANVFIKGSIDGASTDSLGRFSFTTDQTGELTLCVRIMGYAEYTMLLSAGKLTNIVVKMHR